MKNFLSNKNIARARMSLVAIMFAMFLSSFMSVQEPQLFAPTFVVSLVGAFALAYGYSRSERRFYMFVSCSSIDADIELDCDDPLSGGVESELLLANFDQRGSITYNPTNPLLITAWTMAAGGAKFWSIQGQLQSLEPKHAMVKGKYQNQFEHEVGFYVFKIDPATKLQINKMVNGNFIAIVKNNYVGATGNCKHEAYGAGTGMKCEVVERNPGDVENLGAFKVLLKTAEYARESRGPATIFITDAAATETLITALKTPTV